MRWFEEILHEGFHVHLLVDSVIHETKTEHQHLIIFENPEFGRVLALDGVVQTTERDEFIYHEMLAHTPIFAHGKVRTVLIIGGGDGGMLEEVLKHTSVEGVVQVEIDDAVVNLSRQFLRSICGNAYEDPRTELIICDGFKFVQESERKFDLIIVDSTDPMGPGAVLFSRQFYEGCKRCLMRGGVLVTQNGVPFLQRSELFGTIRTFSDMFESAACFLASVPAYTGGDMAFGWGSDDEALLKLSPAQLNVRFERAAIETHYYNPDVHKGAFALPPYISDLIG